MSNPPPSRRSRGLRPFVRELSPLAVLLALTATALADPPLPRAASPTVATTPAMPGADDVAAVFVTLAQARASNDAATLRSLVALPGKVTWRGNDGHGDCTVAHNQSYADPPKAAAAYAVPPAFLAALKRDKGRARQGTLCDPDGATPYMNGDAAVTVTGDQAKVVYVVSICGAGDSTHTYTLRRVAGKWQIVSLDDGCHYD